MAAHFECSAHLAFDKDRLAGCDWVDKGRVADDFIGLQFIQKQIAMRRVAMPLASKELGRSLAFGKSKWRHKNQDGG
jgi:hypothetical protein